MDSLLKHIEAGIAPFKQDVTYWIAYSGGLDSHVLLHLMANLRTQHALKLHAVYINHGLSTKAHDWAMHCAAVCQSLQIPFSHYAIQATPNAGESLEAIARDKRYEKLAECLQADDVLLTAHHQNDQAETVLLQLLRGAGLKGLAAMPRHKNFANGTHIRPMLDVSRNELEQYANHHQLQWIEDESNTNKDFTRNFIRHEIMPLLQQRWPSVESMLARAAEHAAETQCFIDDWVNTVLPLISGSVFGTLSVSQLLQYTQTQQRYLIRAWLQQNHFALPSTVKMQQILQTVLLAAEDKTPCVDYGDIEIRRYRDDLYVMQTLSAVPNAIEWDFATTLNLNGVGTLQSKRVQGMGLRADIASVTVKFRLGGEVMQLPGRDCHHELKKLFQTWNVPTWMRDRVPLLFVGNELIAVVGYAVGNSYLASEDEDGRNIELIS